MDGSRRHQLEKTLKRIRETKEFEGICLQGWQCKLLIEYIEELKARNEKCESTDGRLQRND